MSVRKLNWIRRHINFADMWCNTKRALLNTGVYLLYYCETFGECAAHYAWLSQTPSYHIQYMWANEPYPQLLHESCIIQCMQIIVWSARCLSTDYVFDHTESQSFVNHNIASSKLNSLYFLNPFLCRFEITHISIYCYSTRYHQNFKIEGKHMIKGLFFKFLVKKIY